MKPSYIDHIVLIVKDVNATAEFYNKFLGQPEHKNNEEISFKIEVKQSYFLYHS